MNCDILPNDLKFDEEMDIHTNISNFTDLKSTINHIVLQELQKASHFVTRHTIHLRVMKQVADILELPWYYCIDTKTIYIHPDNMLKLDEKWKKCIQGNLQISHDEMNAYEKIKSADYIKVPDILKFITILTRKDIIERDPNNREKILKSNDLNIILAVDGFMGYIPIDMKNYVDNVKYGVENCTNSHISTVRKMYESPLVKGLSGTDASCVIFLALLKIYLKYCKDDQANSFLTKEISDVENYLIKNSTYYSDITIALKEISNLIEFYETNVKDIEQIALVKISTIIEKSKKKKSNYAVEKRGRKKNLIQTESDGDSIEKKRKRTVKPFVDSKQIYTDSEESVENEVIKKKKVRKPESEDDSDEDFIEKKKMKKSTEKNNSEKETVTKLLESEDESDEL